MHTPGRRARVLVAIVMTLWTTLQGATLVVAAVRGGGPTDAFRFAYTGMVVMALVALTVVAWRWVARAGSWLPAPPGNAPTSRVVQDEPDPEEVPPRQRHSGLGGHEPPPTRW